MFVTRIYSILQKIYWPILRVALFCMYRVKVSDPHGTLKHIPPATIIVSNHKTPFDPFVISVLFPWNSSVYPIRFMAEFEKFELPQIEFFRKIGLIYFIYAMFGAFSSRRGQGIERAIELPVYFLKHAESVLIFPEGIMVRGDKLGKIYRGAGMIAARTQRQVLPIAINYRKGEYQVNIGKLFTIPKEATDRDMVQKVQSALNALYKPLRNPQARISFKRAAAPNVF